MERSSRPRRLTICVATIGLALLPFAATSLAQEPTLVPPTVIEPVDGTRVPSGTHVDFVVRTFPGDDGLYAHLSRSPATDECGVVASDVRTYGLDPTSDPSVYRANTALLTFPGYWMITPGTIYWQAYRIEHHFDADGCIETPVQTLTITSGGAVVKPEARPVVPKTITVRRGAPITVKFSFPSPARITTVLKKGTNVIKTVRKTTLKAGPVKVSVPPKAASYCSAGRAVAAAASCPLPKGKYTVATKIVSKKTGNKFNVRQILTVLGIRG